MGALLIIVALTIAVAVLARMLAVGPPSRRKEQDEPAWWADFEREFRAYAAEAHRRARGTERRPH